MTQSPKIGLYEVIFGCWGTSIVNLLEILWALTYARLSCDKEQYVNLSLMILGKGLVGGWGEAPAAVTGCLAAGHAGVNWLPRGTATRHTLTPSHEGL